jgi:hypothetical protein
MQDTNVSHNLLVTYGSDITANRTLTITTGDADRALNMAAIDGAWTSYTPTITAGSGSFTSVSATGKYRTVGKTTNLQIKVTITTNGSAATTVNATLPNTNANDCVLFGRESAVLGSQVMGAISAGATATGIVIASSGAYPGGDGHVINICGTYENT